MIANFKAEDDFMKKVELFTRELELEGLEEFNCFEPHVTLGKISAKKKNMPYFQTQKIMPSIVDIYSFPAKNFILYNFI